GAAGAGHVALDGAAVVLEGGGGVAEERAATGGGRLAVGHRDREGPVLAVLEARLREVPVHDRTGRGVLLEDAGDVPGGGAERTHLLGVRGRGGDRLRRGRRVLLGRLGGRVLGRDRCRGRLPGGLVVVVVGEQRPADED